ncbi:TetR/AcrR family transcriptional regulator [Duganella sp. FT3S]|uniref:TetR/AcrR family transcriptional regulator n=1 Tax=Rugamonas fusca TaxID=2758568 RepID=A0A7W2EJ37_9BURK|nr:TetR/AcrR family transcriptional regulator [Rugamonas fusca]MBA5606764.1 TetR/AcrR family transcriptional regulator [Rugamonas fusca]
MTNTELTVDHRTRVAAQRRERTRARLLESALQVFAEKGPEAAVIDDVIALAGMARGSFYNYFRTNEELLAGVAGALSDELLRLIDPVVQLHADPAARVACGARLLLHAVRGYPLLGAFLSRLKLPVADGQLIGVAFLARDLDAGIAQQRFAPMLVRVAIDLVTGTLLCAAQSQARETLPANYPEAVVHAVLLGLGIPADEAARLVALPLPKIVLPDNSILNRTAAADRP